MKSVLYYVMPEKIINGTLFYAMEYFLIINEIEPTKLILKCDIKTYDFIIECFHIKYNYDYKLDKFILYSNYTSLPKHIKNNVLILDTQTYKKCKCLIKSKIFLYSQNGKNDIFNKTYGFYKYQNFNIKTRLKLGLKYYKKYTELYDNFSSAGNMKNTSKKPNIFTNLMEYKNWYYKHNTFDTNNRFIIEARYFNKNLSIQEYEKFDDSIDDRLNSNINNFILDTNDMMIKEFIDE